MPTIGIFQIALLFAAFLCSLVAGFLFGFAVVAMPGLKNLPDSEFIRAFQVMDRIIQNNQPLFIIVWMGSIVAILAAVGFGFGQTQGGTRLLLIAAALIYLLGVQLPTITINIPLNNQLQTLQVGTMNEKALGAARQNFEPRWNRWNAVRTVFASLVSVLLLLLLVTI